MLVVLLLFLQSTLQDAASGDESSLWSSVVTVAAVLFVMLTVLAQTRHRLRSAKAKKGLGAEFLALARRLQQSNTQNKAADEDALSAHEMREVDLELIRVFSITCRESLEKNFEQPLSLTSVEEQHFFMASLNISNLQIESFRQFYNSLDKDSS